MVMLKSCIIIQKDAGLSTLLQQLQMRLNQSELRIIVTHFPLKYIYAHTVYLSVP